MLHRWSSNGYFSRRNSQLNSTVYFWCSTRGFLEPRYTLVSLKYIHFGNVLNVNIYCVLNIFLLVLLHTVVMMCPVPHDISLCAAIHDRHLDKLNYYAKKLTWFYLFHLISLRVCKSYFRDPYPFEIIHGERVQSHARLQVEVAQPGGKKRFYSVFPQSTKIIFK